MNVLCRLSADTEAHLADHDEQSGQVTMEAGETACREVFVKHRTVTPYPRLALRPR